MSRNYQNETYQDLPAGFVPRLIDTSNIRGPPAEVRPDHPTPTTAYAWATGIRFHKGSHCSYPIGGHIELFKSLVTREYFVVVCSFVLLSLLFPRALTALCHPTFSPSSLSLLDADVASPLLDVSDETLRVSLHPSSTPFLELTSISVSLSAWPSFKPLVPRSDAWQRHPGTRGDPTHGTRAATGTVHGRAVAAVVSRPPRILPAAVSDALARGGGPDSFPAPDALRTWAWVWQSAWAPCDASAPCRPADARQVLGTS